MFDPSHQYLVGVCVNRIRMNRISMVVETNHTAKQIGINVEQIIAGAMHDYGLDARIDAITGDSLFGNDLGMDGEDVHAIIIQCEECFKVQIPDDTITEQSCVGELTKLIIHLLMEKAAREEMKAAEAKK